jgi:hypothetical protein
MHDMRRRSLVRTGRKAEGMTYPGNLEQRTVEPAPEFVDAPRSAILVRTLRSELRRLRVLARCLAATEVALVARIVVSGFSVVAVTLVVGLAVLLLACVRLSLVLGAGAARMETPSRDTHDARAAHRVRRPAVSSRSVRGPGNGDPGRRRRS